MPQKEAGGDADHSHDATGRADELISFRQANRAQQDDAGAGTKTGDEVAKGESH